MLNLLFTATWLLMYLFGYLLSVVSMYAYCSMFSPRFAPAKALLLPIVWFITMPLIVGSLLWSKRQQIQTLTEQVIAFQQMQAQMAELTKQLSGMGMPLDGGKDVDSNYE